MHKIKNQAFTLAEILITIGITGIIAALTLPLIIKNIRMKVFETAFKKQYSVLQNAVDYASMENGYRECYTYYPSGKTSYKKEIKDCEALKNNIISLLKLQELSNFNKNYKKKSDVLTEGGTTINSKCSYDYYLSSSETYITNDGAVYMFFSSNINTYMPFVIIDINGEKKPNKWGYDVFFMMFSNKNQNTNKILITDEFCSIIEKGGKFPRTILQNRTENLSPSYYWR